MDIFLKIFIISSIIILTGFFIQLIIKINILPINFMNRGYIDIDRNLMISEGLMPLLIPLGVVIIVFKLKFNLRNLILIGFILMSIVYLLELWRRNIAAIFIFFILATIINSFITKQFKLMFNNALRISLLISVLIFITYLVFPRYLQATIVGIQESISVIKFEKTKEGERNLRLGFSKPFIVEQFDMHPFLGTGFDYRWRGLGETRGI